MVDVYKIVVEIVLVGVFSDWHVFLLILGLELLLGHCVAGNVFELRGMLLIVMDRKLDIGLLTLLLDHFLLLRLFVPPEPPSRFLLLLLGLSLNVPFSLLVLVFLIGGGIHVSTWAHELFGSLPNLLYVLVEIHFEGWRLGLCLGNLLFLLLLEGALSSSLGQRHTPILINSISAVPKLELIQFLRQIDGALRATGLFGVLGVFLEDLCDATLSGLVVVLIFTVAVFIVVIFGHCRDFPLVKQLRISARSLFLADAAKIEKLLVRHFFFFGALVSKFHELLWRQMVGILRHPSIILLNMNFVGERFFTFGVILFGGGLLMSFIRGLF